MVTPRERDGLLLVLGFSIAAAVAVVLPAGPLGGRVTAAGVLFTLGLVGLAVGPRPEWRPLARLLVPLSALQVLPDAFLVNVVGSLEFDDIGGPRILDVPVYMALLWSPPLFIVLESAHAVARRLGPQWGPPFATAAATVLFAATEATLWALPLWHARDVAMVAHVALYVVPAEALLGLTSYLAWRLVESRSLDAFAAAGLVSTGYTGALALGFLLIER